MKKILLDTNVILDIALERDDFVTNSIELLLLINKLDYRVFISATTVTDIYYISKKQVGRDKTIHFLTKLFEHIKIAGVDTTIILNALNSGLKDFEDAVQIETAKQNDISIVITRNKKDFENSNMNIYTPAEYINKLKSDIL